MFREEKLVHPIFAAAQAQSDALKRKFIARGELVPAAKIKRGDGDIEQLVAAGCLFWPNWTPILAETGQSFQLKLDTF